MDKQANFKPQGTWNLYWGGGGKLGCGNFQGWCDCTKGKLWKNSSLSNPIHHTPQLGSPEFWCQCHTTNGVTGVCIYPNLGEMDSVTCHL